MCGIKSASEIEFSRLNSLVRSGRTAPFVELLFVAFLEPTYTTSFADSTLPVLQIAIVSAYRRRFHHSFAPSSRQRSRVTQTNRCMRSTSNEISYPLYIVSMVCIALWCINVIVTRHAFNYTLSFTRVPDESLTIASLFLATTHFVAYL